MWITTSVSSSQNLRQRNKEKTVLLLGSSEGYLRIFTEKGKCIHEQRFHNAPILKLKCNHCLNSELEDVIVVYSRVVVRLDSKSLSIFVKNASIQEQEDNGFTYKKWILNGQEKINDIVCCLPCDGNILDIYKSKPSQCIVGVGSKPMFAVYTSDEKNVYISAGRIASQVATKVTSAVVSFAKSFIWGDTKEEEQKKPEAPVPGVPISIKYELRDHPRDVKSIQLDITGQYAVTADSLGRVMIVDVRSMIIMKMLKGYREAQCSWLYVPKGRQYLVIYVPRRGLLELWGMNERIAAINVGKDCILLHPRPTLGSSHHYNECFLMNGDGKLEKIRFVDSQIDKTSIFITEVQTDNPDQHFLEQFLKIVRGNHGVSAEDLIDQWKSTIDKIFTLFKDPSFILRALEELDSRFPISYHLYLAENALKLVTALSDDFNLSTIALKIKTCIVNRIKLLKAFQVLKQGDSEDEEEKESWEKLEKTDIWEKLVGNKFPDITSSKSIIKTIPGIQYVDFIQFLNCFDMSNEQIKLKPNHTIAGVIVMPIFEKNAALFYKTQSIIKLSDSELQVIFEINAHHY